MSKDGDPPSTGHVFPVVKEEERFEPEYPVDPLRGIDNPNVPRDAKGWPILRGPQE